MAETLTQDQAAALNEIMTAYSPGERHLLSGYAGSGKTFLMQRVAREFLKRRKSISLTAATRPTHALMLVNAR